MTVTHIFMLLSIACGSAYAHEGLPNQLSLGVAGFPDCTRARPELELSGLDAEMDLVCSQRVARPKTIKIGCVGDSITEGAQSTGGNHTYPGQLQILLDQAYGASTYSVTNLGASGSTLHTKGDSPYWQRPQFKALTAAKWDIIIIMLGTNDAKDPGNHGPNNWQHDCGDLSQVTLNGCSFAEDYKSMIDLVKTLGNTEAGPRIYVMIPPPLMEESAIGANQTVINSVYPKLIPLIQKANAVNGPIDVYSGLGGVLDWKSRFPQKCDHDTVASWPACQWFCDAQSCDQCHPNNNGYHQLAKIVLAGLMLERPIVVV